MKILKRIALVIVALIALVLIIALFVNGEYSVTRSIEINKPKQEVFNYVKFLKNQNEFSYWNLQDPSMKHEYTGTDGTVGFKAAWESEKMGQGEQEIASIEEGDRIGYNLHFIKPFDALAVASMTTTTVGNDATKVDWNMASKMNYPMNFMLLFMDMDKAMGPQLEEGLSNLKANMEGMATSTPPPAVQ